MKKLMVDLTNIHTPGGMHVYLAYKLGFPAHYGRNLDALHDMLTEIGEETLLTIRRPAQLPQQMERFFLRLAIVLHDAQEENPNLKAFVEIVE